jgi:hypothetical protein
MVNIPSRPHDVQSLPRHKDTSLLPGEDENLRKEIVDTMGDEWLQAKNVWLANRAPVEVIGTPDEFHVRALLRSLRVAALS